jgi:hypothetical protein
MESEFEIPPLNEQSVATAGACMQSKHVARPDFCSGAETDTDPLELDILHSTPTGISYSPGRGLSIEEMVLFLFFVWAICWFGGCCLAASVASEHIVKKLPVSIVLSLMKAVNDQCQQASVRVFISFVLFGAASWCEQTILCVACVCFGFVGVVGTNVVVVTVVGSIPVDKSFSQDE